MTDHAAVACRSGRRWRARRARHGRAEEGNTLVLMPVGVLILLVLGGIAVDFAAMFAAQRGVASVAGGLATDAAGAVAQDRLFDDGLYTIDGERAQQIVTTLLANRDDRIQCELTVDGDRVTVGCEDPAVRLVFSPALDQLPGVSGTVTVRAVSTARAAAGPD